ncbi:MAG: surface carbohydrate biosynthesis protein [Betaproteobacteria bacterium]
MSRPRVCLIVDNPLRDLDGLVLVAWQLAQRDCEAWLVPMYEQAFDVRAVDADFVLANYARANNRSHLSAYLGEGIKVGILDTEGVGGKNAEEFAALVGSDIGAGFVNLYCTWGLSQGAALAARGVVRPEVLRVTGCPRYDYCAAPWRDALPRPAAREGFVLINTNFPTVNPRFSSGSGDEVRSMIGAGFDLAFAQAYVRDARAAQAGMIALLEAIVDRFPSVGFVLRPHPFESTVPYQALASRPNFEVRQEGTSIEWLNACRLLLHLNCSTAVEAAMLGKVAISPAWLDSPTLNVEGPHRVSRHAASVDDLAVLLTTRLETLAPAASVYQAIEPLYHRIDGQASQRVAQAILETLQQPLRAEAPELPARFRYTLAARRLLGHRASKVLQDLRAPPPERARRAAKLFTSDQVGAILHRIERCAPGSRPVAAEPMGRVPVAVPRWASGTSVRISAVTS